MHRNCFLLTVAALALLLAGACANKPADTEPTGYVPAPANAPTKKGAPEPSASGAATRNLPANRAAAAQ